MSSRGPRSSARLTWYPLASRAWPYSSARMALSGKSNDAIVIAPSPATVTGCAGTRGAMHAASRIAAEQAAARRPALRVRTVRRFRTGQPYRGQVRWWRFGRFRRRGRKRLNGYVLIQAEVGMASDVGRVLNKVDGVTRVDLVTGPYDVIAITKATDFEELGTLMARIQSVEGVTRTLTCSVLHF